MKKHTTALIAVALLAGTLTACSSGDSGSGGSGGSGADSRGPITFANGKDTTSYLKKFVDGWNSKHPDEKVTFVELSEKADDQRNALVQDFQAGSGSYDVAGLDVVWTAEFAARKWLVPLTDLDTSKLFPATVATGTYDGTLYGAPFNTNAGFLYYRKDLVEKPPTTWAELEQMCSIAKANSINCYAGQFAQYEGLTVNFSEAVNSAGGSIVDEKGNASVDTPEAKAGLEFLVNGFKNGTIPGEAITYMEEESRRAFQSGSLLFLRNWPYVYNLANEPGADSVVQGKVGIAPIPGKDGVGASTLGGYNLGISAASKNQATAKDFVAYMISEDIQRQVLAKMGNPSTMMSLYDDPEMQAAVPYLPTLKEALNAAKPRPQAVSYSEFSQAISTDVYKALQGQQPVDKTLSGLQTSLQKIIDESQS